MASADVSVQPTSISLDQITTDDGLPQNSVRAVLVDHDGFVWAGTEKGLARYDGHRFINFSELIPEIPEDVSLGLQLDSKNRIWTSWYTHSLRILSADRRKVLVMNQTDVLPDDLTTNMPTSFIELESGDFWFPGYDRLFRLDRNDVLTSFPTDFQVLDGAMVQGQLIFTTSVGLLLVNPETESMKYISVPGQQDGTIFGGAVVALEDAIIFCHVNGVFRYQLTTGEFKQLTGDNDLKISRCKLLGSDLLISLSEPQEESFILKTLDVHTGEITENPAGLPASANKLLSIGLYDTLIDRDGGRWALIGDELYWSDGGSDEFRTVNLPSKIFGNEKVFSQSRSGAVWLRTDSEGLAKFSRYSQRFQTITPPESISESGRIRAIAVDEQNNVWLGSDEQKVLYWNRAEDSWVDMLPGNTGVIKGIEILPDGSVWVILPDIGKLVGFDSKTGRLAKEHNFKTLSTAIKQTPDGRLVVAPGAHVLLMNPHTGASQKLNKEPLNGQVRAFEQDAEGNTWVGTHEFGLIKIDADGETTYWTTKNSSISSNKIFSLHIDRNKLLWIGTWHGGLMSFNPVTQKFRHYGMKAGLPDSTVFGILEDKAGQLWLSTYDGLVRFSPCSGESCQPEVYVFTQKDGLQANEFDADSHYQSSRGEMFFAGHDGLNAFYPETIAINQNPPAVRISRILLDDKPLPGAESEFVTPQTVYLPFDFGDLHLEVSNLDFNNPVKNRFQYRNLERGEAWKDLQQPFLRLHGLNNGSHTFQFRGANNDGVWSVQEAGIKLMVAPPLYRHPLLLGLYFLIATLSPIAYFRNQQARYEQNRQQLENDVAKRTRELVLANSSRERFFANVSHEICSPVHMILLMLENHMKTASSEEKNLYKSATGYAAQLMVYLKQLVSEARSHEIDGRLYAADISGIINRLVLTNKPIAVARSISIEIESLPSEPVTFYSTSAISIFSNLLCNALVYTPENGSIKISGEVDANVYKMAICNTITSQQATDINRYFERGARGDFNPNYFGGHGLGLSIVTSAIETLGGSIHVELEDEQHIVFKIELPLAGDNLRIMPVEDDLAFSYEQVLAIKLISDDEHPVPTPQKANNGVSVLIIEDDILMANLLGQSLSASFMVHVAGSYHDGVRLLRKHQPDVILCDLFLPDQSGFEVLKATRANRMSMNTFFVMMTASISEEDRLKSRELGVDQFVRKPVSAENLRLLILNHMSLSKQRFAQREKESLIRKARFENAKGSQNSFKERFTEALEEFYQDPDTTIAAIQTRMSLSYSALMDKCKKTFGKTPKRLLIEKRISVAKDLLSSSGYRIGLISELAGFSTHSQFAIVFKKETGQTPVEYRKEN